MSQIQRQPHGVTPPPPPPTYIGVADVQNHQAELTVLILVQLMDQLSVVSLQHKKHAAPRSDSKTREIQQSCIIHTQKELVFQPLAHNIACVLRPTSQKDKLRQ